MSEWEGPLAHRARIGQIGRNRSWAADRLVMGLMKGAAKTGLTARVTVEPLDRAPDPAARIEEVFARHQNELVGTLYHLVGNVEDARDAVQEAFIKCWQHRENIDEIHSLKAWIFQVAINTGRDMRGSAWRRKREPMPVEAQDLAGSDRGPSAEAEQREEIARLRRAVTALRPEEKEVFLLRENGELTYEEIAAAMGIPVGTVKTRMRMALAHLRVHLGIAMGQA